MLAGSGAFSEVSPAPAKLACSAIASAMLDTVILTGFAPDMGYASLGLEWVVTGGYCQSIHEPRLSQALTRDNLRFQQELSR
jgi:hypothetical protein